MAADLDLYLGARGEFDWSRSHCGHFVGGWVRQVTGRDALAGLPSLPSALLWMRRVQTLGGLCALVTRQLGVEPVDPRVAKAGDIVMMPGPVTGGALGICCGRTAALAHHDRGVQHVDMTEALHAWPLAEVRP